MEPTQANGVDRSDTCCDPTFAFRRFADNPRSDSPTTCIIFGLVEPSVVIEVFNDPAVDRSHPLIILSLMLVLPIVEVDELRLRTTPP